MRRLTMRAATIAGAAIVTFTGTAAAAHAHPRDWLRPVRLVPYQAAANLIPPHMSGLKIFVYDALTNRPLPGRQIYFANSGNTEICRAVSDTWGEAACNGPLQLSPTTVDTLANGYWATFQGDPFYAPARTHGPINVIVDPSL